MTEIKAAQYTIAAVATAPGRGGVGIVRISGELTREIAISILGKCPSPRRAEFLSFNHGDGQVIDTGIAIFFPGPHSFTGEDVLELQGHGGPVVLGMLLDRVLHLGARLAEPGEFSKRAFLNDKIDLTQAEAIADLIDSSSQQAARLAMRSLQGEFSDFVNDLVEQLIQLRMFVESAIDFPEEEVDFLDDDSLREKLQQILNRLRMSIKSAHQGTLLREGLHVVIAGRPNSGKSTLLNELSGRDSAIVDELAGTTRDILREQLHLDGLPLHIIDTAGLRESSNTVEKEGIRRTWKEIELADQILYLVDDKIGITTEDEASLKQMEQVCSSVTIIRNKIDLTGKPVDRQQNNKKNEIAISAKSGLGIEVLRDHIKEVAGYQSSSEGGFMARRRHIEALTQALQFVEAGERQLTENKAGELLAEELRSAQYALGEITGEVSADDLLGRIFSSFCIGK